MAGFPPFYDDDPMATYKKILKGTLTFPAHVSVTARDLIRKLLQVDLSKRYGCLVGGVADIKSHPFMRCGDFASMRLRQIEPPIRQGSGRASRKARWRRLDASRLRNVLLRVPQARGVPRELHGARLESTSMDC